MARFTAPNADGMRRFEALVAEIAAKFIQNFDPKRERCWIAEREGAIVGSVFLVKKSERVAKLRLLLVEPSARGWASANAWWTNVFASRAQTGYRKITLWTQSNLLAARHIYKNAGFRLVKEKRREAVRARHEFGDLGFEVIARFSTARFGRHDTSCAAPRHAT